MAAQSLCHHIFLFLLMSFLVGGYIPCEQQQRSRKPPLDFLQWEAYWVPLMIILGGCCAMAWSILFIAYNMGQRGGKMLPQIPSAPAEEGMGEGVPSQQQDPPKEMNEKSNPVENKGSKELLRIPLEAKGSREGIENPLERRPSREGNPKENKGAKEEIENPLEIKATQEGLGNQLERRGCQEDSPLLQGKSDPDLCKCEEAEDQPCRKLWATMERELERLLQLLRFCRSTGPCPLGGGSQVSAGEECPSPPAEETPQPTPVPEPPTVPAEEMPRPPRTGQSPATMHLIICGLPNSACPNRGRRRRGGSRGRK